MVSPGPLSFTQIGMLETGVACRHLAYRRLDGEHDALVSWILIEIRISLTLLLATQKGLIRQRKPI